MSNSRASQLSRRGFMAAGGAAALGALISACGGGDGGAKAAAGGGAWTFSDDRGKKIDLKARPRRIVTYVGAGAALRDFGITDQIVGIYGPAKRQDGSVDPQAGSLPVDELEIIGNAYGEFNLEKYAALRPELLIDNMFVEPNLFYVPAESADKIYALAPGLAISTGAITLTKPIERYAQLAAALGADPRSAKVAQDKARFEKAAESVRAAVKANGGLKVLACSGSADLFYASNPGKNTDLIYFKELGVELITPDKLNKDGYFEELSWENADKYEADLLMLDSRTQALQPKDLASKPAWRDLPAVKANQVIGWNPEPVFSYAGCAPILEALAKTVQTAKKL
ncbi:ABC transporter substrate-binding protein [Actinomadura sp. 21ATH]|uniref:ABC transporter substrate-binding protein n=1 Tax=Actinomadura sp. 21ATH TaxID=1735444 RepID=UPI0035C0C61E